MSGLRLGETQLIDWETLEGMRLVEEVRCLIRVGAWHHMFEISDPTYQELMLGVLATFIMARRTLS